MKAVNTDEQTLADHFSSQLSKDFCGVMDQIEETIRFIQMVAGNHGGRYVQGLSKRELKNLLEEYQMTARDILDATDARRK